MHPGSIHYGIEPYADILAEVVAKHELVYGSAYGGITTLSNAHCILYLNEVETSVTINFALASAPEKKYGVLDFLMAMVPDGARKYPLHVSDTVIGEDRVKQELGLIRDVLASGVMDCVLKGDQSWIPMLEEFNAEYDRLYYILLDPPLDEHPEKPIIRRKQAEYDLSWMDDVKRLLAEAESSKQPE
ncbi:MAG: hypothetical protein U0176_06005 [Bacteroidia bacterium]